MKRRLRSVVVVMILAAAIPFALIADGAMVIVGLAHRAAVYLANEP